MKLKDNKTYYPIGNGDFITSREKEILELICNGLTDEQISKKLFIAKSTVKTHCEHLRQKFHIKGRISRTQLVVKALKSKIACLVDSIMFDW